jgi:predicted CxxxxCH...CXXCH cytochrome family protein
MLIEKKCLCGKILGRQNSTGKCMSCAAKSRVYTDAGRKARSILNSGAGNPRWTGGKAKTICATCHKSIEVENFKEPRNHFCSRKCYGIKKSSEMKIKWSDSLYKEKVLGKILSKTDVKPNGSELVIIHLLKHLSLDKCYKYVGNRAFWIDRFNPDFVSTSDKKIIEFFGEYWHKDVDRDKRRIEAYSRNGYKTLIIWQSEIKDLEKIKENIRLFHGSN